MRKTKHRRTIRYDTNQIKSNCTFIRRLLKSDFSQAPPTSMRAQTRQFSTIDWTVPVRCPRSSNCQADCSTLWGRKHGSFWVQNGQCVCVRWSVLRGQRIVVGHALEPSGLECRCLRNMLDIMLILLIVLLSCPAYIQSCLYITY